MTNAKKNFLDEPALDFLGAESQPEENTEIGMERVEVPEGYILRPEPKTVHVHLLMQPSLKTKLKAEADQQGISVNEMIHRILMDRYRAAAKKDAADTNRSYRKGEQTP